MGLHDLDKSLFVFANLHNYVLMDEDTFTNNIKVSLRQSKADISFEQLVQAAFFSNIFITINIAAGSMVAVQSKYELTENFYLHADHDLDYRRIIKDVSDLMVGKLE